uniref:Uncharacterized protein n=1 Tax=Parascaris univalens TaxID=6257 RepID=A0A915A2T2_PARUN
AICCGRENMRSSRSISTCYRGAAMMSHVPLFWTVVFASFGLTINHLAMDAEFLTQKLLISETVQLIQGDAIVVNFKVLRPSMHYQESFRVSLINDDTVARAFHLEMSSYLTSMGSRSAQLGWQYAHDANIKLHHGGDHWCSIHIRIVRNNYQVCRYAVAVSMKSELVLKFWFSSKSNLSDC